MRFSIQRKMNLVGFLICCALLGFAYYLQYAKGLQPCPLCMVQRILYYTLAVVLLLATLHNPKTWGWRVYGILTLLISLLGGAAAARQVWLQTHPTPGPETCLPGLHYMLTNMPFTEAAHLIMTGTDKCAEVHWTFLATSIAGWTLVFFVLFGLLALVEIFLPKPQ